MLYMRRGAWELWNRVAQVPTRISVYNFNGSWSWIWRELLREQTELIPLPSSVSTILNAFWCWILVRILKNIFFKEDKDNKMMLMMTMWSTTPTTTLTTTTSMMLTIITKLTQPIFFFYTLIILKQVSLEYLVSFCTPKFRYEIYTQWPLNSWLGNQE